jgi:integrase
MCRRRQIWRGYNEDGSSRFERKQYPDKPMGGHGLHDWWYGCLERAGIVSAGRQRSGEKMHKARHSAGQALLEETHDIVLVQKLLGHADPRPRWSTTWTTTSSSSRPHADDARPEAVGVSRRYPRSGHERDQAAQADRG